MMFREIFRVSVKREYGVATIDRLPENVSIGYRDLQNWRKSPT